MPFALSFGCTGRASFNVINLDYVSLDPQSPPPRSLDMDECYWWTDDEDAALHIAMRRAIQLPFLGPAGKFSVAIALDLAQPPAGRERQYELDATNALALAEIGPACSRFACILGGVSVARVGQSRYRGNLRMEMTREALGLFGGWGKPSCTAWGGTFLAIEDRAAGEQIRGHIRARFAAENPPESTTAPAAQRAEADSH